MSSYRVTLLQGKLENVMSGTQTNIEHRGEIPVSDANPSLNEPFKNQDIIIKSN